MGRNDYCKDYDTFASESGSQEKYFMMYESMMKHPSYINLSNTAKNLYNVCRTQARSKQGRSCLYKYGKAEHGEEWIYNNSYFVLPAKHQKEYGLNNRSNVSKYIKELIDAGFIKCVEKNKHRHKVNVYQFCTDWRNK